MKRILEEAKRLIRINSITTNGNEELANVVMSMVQERGLNAQLQLVTHSLEDVSKRQFNVVGCLGDPLVDRKIRKGLLLTSHLDTAGPGILENWNETSGDPFSAQIKDGKFFGLGAADSKLDFLCKLHAVERYREKKLRMPVYLVGTCGEELGMFGARYLIKSLALNPKYVVVGQPSMLRIVHSHKCLSLFRVNVGYQQVERDARGYNRKIDFHAFGRSAHAAYPHLGANAIYSGLDFLKRAADAGFDMRFTRLDGGEAVNKVPDRSSTQFYLTSHQFEDFKRFFRDISQSENRERAYRVELGGGGDAGVRFLPDPLFSCIQEIADFFRTVAADFQKVKDETFDPAFSTVNFGRLLQTPGQIMMNFDLRILPDLVVEDIEKHIQSGIQAIAARYLNLNVTAVCERMNPGLSVRPDSELIQFCEDAMRGSGIEPKLAKMSTSTEAAQFAQAGYESVVFGPGHSQGNSHSPNEYCLLDHLERATSFYERLIERVCV